MLATNPKETVTIKQAMNIFNCCRMTIYRMIKSGKLPAITLNTGGVRIAKIDILAYRQNNRHRPKRTH